MREIKGLKGWLGLTLTASFVLGATGWANAGEVDSTQKVEVEIAPGSPLIDPKDLEVLHKETMAEHEKVVGDLNAVKEGEAKAAEPKKNKGVLHSVIERVPLKYKLAPKVSSHGLSLGGSWQRRLEPSYDRGFTSVVDDHVYSLGRTNDIDEKDYGKWISTVGGEAKVRFLFARQVYGETLKEHLKMLVIPPLTPFKNLPTTAQKAMDSMKLKDFVSLQAGLNLFASWDQVKALTGSLPLSASLKYMISGEFQIHLYRVSEQKFRMKLIGVRGREPSLTVGLGLDPADDFKVVGVKLVDRGLKSIASFNLFRVSFSAPRTNLFMVDYILDFTDPEVRAAYDDLIGSVVSTKRLRLINPITKTSELREMLLGDVSRFEDLFQRDKNKSIDRRMADRMFLGENDVIAGSNFKLEFGTSELAKWLTGRNYAENFLIVTDGNDRVRYFYMPTFTMRDDFGYFLVHKKERVGTGNLLFETNAKGEISSFGELSFQLDFRSRKFTGEQVHDLKNFIQKRLPSELYSQIKWGPWEDESEDRTNGRVTSTLVFRPGALELLQGENGGDLYYKILNYMKSLPRKDPKIESSGIEATPRQIPDGDIEQNRRHSWELEYKYGHDLLWIVHRLGKIFKPMPEVDKTAAPEAQKLQAKKIAQEAQDRADSFLELRNNDLWQEIGGGALVNFLKEAAYKKAGQKGMDDLLQNIYYEMVWSADDEDTIREYFGKCRNRRLYRAVMTIYSILNDRSADMRLVDHGDVSLPDDKASDPDCQGMDAKP